jgi:hypothetical protein
MKSSRFWTVAMLMIVTLGLLLHRGDVDRVPPSDPLSLMPTTIDGMSSQDYPLDAVVLSVLGKGDFLNRTYSISDPRVAAERAAAGPGGN